MTVITCTATDNVGATASTTVTATVTAPVTRPFHVVQEYFHDGGGIATNQTQDLGIDAASFKAVLTSGESSYLAAHHPTFFYFCTPQNLVKATVPPNYPSTLDSNYPATMQNLAATYGIGNVFLFACPEWDNDPGNASWANNRFLEVSTWSPGVTGARPDIPSGLTRQQAYDQWNHFYLANNHNGIIDHHQLGQLLNLTYQQRGYKIMSDQANAGTCHFAFEMGMDLVILERNNDDVSGLIGSIGFIRGAATQYGRQWGIDTSHWRSYGVNGAGATAYNSSQQLTFGWSDATYKRHLYLSYMSGPDALFVEAGDYNTNGVTNINGRIYNPLGTRLQSFCNFALVRHAQRGVPYVPIAIMKDHITFLEPRSGQWTQGREVWCFQMSPNGGENMVHNLLDMLYPNYSTWATSTTAAEPWGSGRWGEQFDIVTDRASNSALGNYRVALIATNAVMDSAMQSKLTAYAQAGGIVVLNAKQLTGTAHETLTGIHITGSASTSGTVTWDSDATTTNEPAFNYATVILGTATRLAHSGTSTPQVTRNVVGAGEVWVTLPDYMSNTANNAALGVGAKVIDTLINRFAVATISGGNHNNIDYTVNNQAGSSGTTTVVTIANTDSANRTWTGTISIPGTGSLVREWISDTNASFTVSGGQVQVSASVPAGDVRVYAVG